MNDENFGKLAVPESEIRTFAEMKGAIEAQIASCDEQLASCENLTKTLRTEKKRWQRMLAAMEKDAE